MSGSNARQRREARRERKAPPAYLVEAKSALLERVEDRGDRKNPGLRLGVKADGTTAWGSPHADEDLWWLGIADAFGTRSDSVMTVFIEQLIDLSGPHNRPSQKMVNAAIGLVQSYRPKNEGEAMLAAQMVAAHLLTMKVATHANGNGPYVIDREARLFSRLARTFAEQTDVMARLKGRKTHQVIQVNYSDNRQQSYTNNAYGGSRDFGGQGQGTSKGETLCIADGNAPRQPRSRPALPRQDESRGTVPEARCEEPAPLPPSRVRTWLRRAFG
jgi:hypothetical protein